MSTKTKKTSKKDQQSFLNNNKQNSTNQLHSSSSESQQDNNDESKKSSQKQQIEPSIDFGDSQMQMKCPFCLQNIRTQIILKPEFISILLGFSLFVIFPHIVTLIVTVLILQLTATRKHRCPLCERQLGNDGKFLVFFKDQVYSFAFGTNGIIISKKILSSIGMGIFIFVILGFKMGDQYSMVEWTQLTWPQFFRQCPFDAVSQKCQYSNQGLTVKNWKGFVMRVQDNRNSIKRHFQHAVSLYIKMNYEQSFNINPQKPDLFLTLTAFQTHEWQQTLDNLSHGDQIMFNATFKYLRNNRGIPIGKHLNVIQLNRTEFYNPNIHVYMNKDQDLWFFQKLSGDKLRKHQQNSDQNKQKSQSLDQKNKKDAKQKQQSNKIIIKPTIDNQNPSNNQKNVIQDQNNVQINI